MNTVLLDAAGTLIRPREPVGATYAEAARRFGADPDPDKLLQAFGEAFGAMPDLAFRWTSMGDLHRQERDWWRTLVGRVVGLSGSCVSDFDAFFEILYGHYAQGRAWECFPDVPPALGALRARGCKLAVVSNFDSRLPGVLRDLGIEEQLDAVIYSSKAGSAKPDPEIFRQALSVLGAAPVRAMHVGDSEEADLGGAAAAGVRGLLVRRDRRRSTDSESEIRSLGEIVARLGEQA